MVARRRIARFPPSYVLAFSSPRTLPGCFLSFVCRADKHAVKKKNNNNLRPIYPYLPSLVRVETVVGAACTYVRERGAARASRCDDNGYLHLNVYIYISNLTIGFTSFDQLGRPVYVVRVMLQYEQTESVVKALDVSGPVVQFLQFVFDSVDLIVSFPGI